jgi:hypothetical protein
VTDPTPEDLLNEVRGLAAVLAMLDRALPLAVHRAHQAGVDSVTLAQALGVHRSTLYRRYMPPEANPKRSGGAADQSGDSPVPG